jgi:alpha-beta hydrolase superfamily lysophospholipase
MADPLDQPEFTRLLFHPLRDYRIGFSTARVRLIDIPIDGLVKVCGRLYPGAGEGRPKLLVFHGNGEIAADYDEIAPLYTQAGIDLFVVDYRGYGRSKGKPTASALLSDALAVFQACGEIFAENRLPPGPLYVMGRSLGSAAAIEVARQAGDEIAGLIIESGFASTFALIERLGLRTRDMTEDRDGFNNCGKIAGVHTRTLVIHGEQDVLIPPDDGRAIFEACASKEKRLVLIPGAGHNDLLMVGLERYRGAIQEFIV